MRSLVWKEWREQRVVLVGSVAFTIAMPLLIALFRSLRNARPDLRDDAIVWLAYVTPLVMWPLFALAAGVVAATAESAGERWAFLLSRPISRARIWTAKLTVAAATTAMLVAVSEIVLGLARPDNPVALPLLAPGDLLGGVGQRWVTLVRMGVPGSVVLALGLGVLFGLIARGQLSAALAAALTGGSATIALAWIRWRIDYLPSLGTARLTADLALVGAAVLVASFLALRRGELMEGKRFAWRAWRATIAVCVLSAGLVVAHLAYDARGLGSHTILSNLEAAGGRVVVTAARDESLSSRTVLSATVEDTRLLPAGPRLSHRGAPSPSGETVYYLSSTTPAFVSARQAIRSFDVMDSTARTLELTDARPSNPDRRPPAISPDGRWAVLASAGAALTIVSLEPDAPSTVRLPSCGRAPEAIWDELRGRLVQMCADDQKLVMRWIDPANGDVTYELPTTLPQRSQSQPATDPGRVAFLVPLDEEPITIRRLVLLDLESRALTSLPVDAQMTVDAAATAPGSVAWIEAEPWALAPANRAGRRARLMVLREGASEPDSVALFEGTFFSMQLDPAGTWLLAGIYGATNSVGTISENRMLRRLAISLTGRGQVDLGVLATVAVDLRGNAAWAAAGQVALLEDPVWPTASGSHKWFRRIRIVDLATGRERLLTP